MTDRPLLDVRNLTVSYDVGGAAALRRRKVDVVKDVSFHIGAGETYGLVGESGSGKSTTGRAILRLAPLSGGVVEFDGTDITTMGREAPLSYRRDVQAVFQDPAASLNPRHHVGRAVTDALRRHGVKGRAARHDRAVEAFEQVGLSAAHLQRFPAEMSGGQLQRVAIARALSLKPRLVICDEAVAALDLSTQGQIVNLLADLQAASGVSYLFIAHDLGVVRHICDRIGVLKKGVLVEQGGAAELFADPHHPYTRTLLAASPASHPEGREERRAARAARRERGDQPAPEGDLVASR
ncbi:ATP-binding cassette domain-containing protein [Demequina sp. SYSU T00039]|uniref:ATP-binding cassette domain-containing protein n=1 Tax=Demequina lignilytica TaxID=3051663 RepID=A0AAW7MAG2_9MICO|nr:MULTISPECIES: ATP-binding cassette domain-containing protein [unclassified Demequina]MDN4478967.1 ATP-binding cassette domain-containing protein [Demequina sp. SYSU T00039-1]MDN4488842.1 ATP-binding cassette domain-containing protein [Demequina sp. SYSU T00039]MDN4491445.1 ATP-binding cassette domain-containing protein [Demequina sp. SYSU T00068]